MADGELTLKLDDRWLGAREALAEFDRTGESHDAESVMAVFRASVAARIADTSQVTAT